MSTEIRVPQLPESVADATLVAWRKKPGEAVSRDENLADLETDKVVLEVPAPANGVIKEYRVNEGATVKSGDLLAIFEAGGKAATAAAAQSTAQAVAQPAVKSSVTAAASAASAPKVSPAARRVLEEQGIAASAVPTSDGRVTKAAVNAHLSQQAATAKSAAAPLPGARSEQRVPMSRLRQRIAQRLVEAQHTAALLTTFNEIDLSAINVLRQRYKTTFEKEHGVKLGFM